MLFDLRSRGRRRTVQVVYLGLAMLMAGGLVLFGVGAGNGFGGILNAFTNNGSGSGKSAQVSAEEKTALKATRLNPSSPAAWGQLVQARWDASGQGSNFDTATNTFTTSGKKELAGLGQAWQHYLTLTSSPDPNLAILAARAYLVIGEYGNSARAWELETQGNSTDLKGYECLTVTAYAAGESRKGDLASTKALSMIPKAQQSSVKQVFTAAKTSTSTAQQAAQQSCGPQ